MKKVARRRPIQHRHVTVTFDGKSAEVDEGMAEIILETWRAGFVTEECCQGRYDAAYGCKRAFIAFPSADAERWLRIMCPDIEFPPGYDDENAVVADLPPLSAEQEAGLEMRRRRTSFSGPKSKVWDHYLLPYDTVDVSVHFTVLIGFPSTDLPDILARLREHNAPPPVPPLDDKHSRCMPRAQSTI